MSILNIITELKKFSSSILSLKNPIDEELIIEFEKNHNVNLPPDYKLLLQQHNGVILYGTEIYGIEKKGVETSYALDNCYIIEHFEVANPMPLYLVPFSPDGGGNHYCFDTRFCDTNSCPIVFWQHDYLYSETNPPEVTNNDLSDWIHEVMIEWTLEDYNYDGSEK
jgi:cell wall assembly regulator SMI1